MSKVKAIQYISQVLALFFLLNSAIALPLVCRVEPSHKIALEKKSASPSQSDVQFPFEENEIEAKDNFEEIQNNFLLDYLNNEPVQYGVSIYDLLFYYLAPPSFANGANFPLYLAKQSLII